MLSYPRSYVAEIKTTLLDVTGDPVATVDEFKIWAKVDGDDENALIEDDIESATNEAETYTRRAIREGDYQTLMKYFHSCIALDVSNVDSTTIVVKYRDTDNAEQTLSSSEYTIKDFGPDEFMQICFDGTMPSLYDRWDAVKIEFSAGYVEIPGRIKTWILGKASSLYEIRQNQLTGTTVHDAFSYAPLMPYKML
jgi:hypothetical protein